MPDEATMAPAEEVEAQDTPTSEAAPEGTPASESTEDSTPSVDWEKRYNDLRPQFDQTNQIVSALRGNLGADSQRQALEALGLEVDGGEEESDDDWVDPDTRIDRLERMLQEREQHATQEQELAAEQEWLADSLDSLEKAENTQLSDEEVELVVSNALANRLDNGQPNLESAYRALRAAQSAYQKSYVESKKATRVPVGQAGDKKIDLSDDQARQKFMAEIMDQEESD